jgi:hypothetical protein
VLSVVECVVIVSVSDPSARFRSAFRARLTAAARSRSHLQPFLTPDPLDTLAAQAGVSGVVWAYDFVEGRTHDGRKFRILTIIDETSRECLTLVVARQLKHEDVLAALADLFIARGAIFNRRPAAAEAILLWKVHRWLAER